MAWAGGTFTRANGANEWVTDFNNGVGIEPARHDTQDNDLATGINQCLNKDGSNSMTGNLNLNNNIPTNIGAGTAAAPAICAGGDVNTGIFSPSADQIGIATNGTERVRIDASGKVGIGTTPTEYLSILAPASAIAAISLRANNVAAAGEMFVGQSGTSAFVYNRANDSLLFGTNNTERMRIDSTGKVGIGVGAPTERLDISGNVKFPASGISKIYSFASSGTDVALDLIAGETSYASNGAAIRIQSSGVGNDGYILFSTNLSGTGSAERMRLTNNGRLGIGINTPSYQLQLSTDSAAKPTTNTWTIASDERIKTNIQPYAKGLEDICKVNPVTYDYNGKGGIAAGPGGVSILAQELQPVFPECVSSYKAKLNDDDAEETDILNYNGHAITFALINAVKELNAKVEALQARVEELEGA
jgi:hypothetical protein